MSEQSEQLERKPNLFITGADTGVGLAVTRAAVRAGHAVAGATSSQQGAALLREIGALPVYPDLTRAGEIRGAITLARAEVVVNCAPQRFLSIPQVRIDHAAHTQALRLQTQALAAVAGKMQVERIIHLSFAWLYGDTHGEAVTEEQPVRHDTELFDAGADSEAAILDGGLPGYVLRCGFVYGAGSAAAQALAESIRRGRAVPQSSGRGAYIHENDLTAVILRLIDHQDEEESAANILNVADAAAIPHTTFLAQLSQSLGIGEPTYTPGFLAGLRTTADQRTLLALDTQVNTNRVKELLTWQPEFATTQDGIERMLMTWRAESDLSISDNQELVQA